LNKTYNMRHQLPLKRFEYCLADPGTTATGRNTRARRTFEMHFSLTSFEIDFEKASLSLVGERIKLKASIFPGYGVDLTEATEEALIFSMEGILENGASIGTCSGLIVLQNIPEGDGRLGREWRLSIHLYDDFSGDREIKFNLWMLPLSENAVLN